MECFVSAQMSLGEKKDGVAKYKTVSSEHLLNTCLETCRDNTSFNGCLRAVAAQAFGDGSDALGLLFNSDMAVRTPLFWKERPIHSMPGEQIESG